MIAILLVALVGPPLLIRHLEADITPPELLPLGGYTARGGKIEDAGGDRLRCRVVILDQGKTRLAIASVEMLTVPESLAQAVARLVGPGTSVFLTATHTHSAPDSQMLNDRMTFEIPGIATFKRRWLAWYADKISKTIVACEAAKPSAAESLSAVTRYVDVNRGRRAGADPDKTFTLIKAGSLRVFDHYAAHATFYDETNNKAREDWPGQDLAHLPLIGAIGDVSPKAPGLDKAPAAKKIAAFWSRIKASLARGPAAITLWRNRDRNLIFFRQPVYLPKPVAHPSFGATYHIAQGLANLLVAKFAPTAPEISAWRIGRLAVIGIPGEPTSHLGRQIVAYGRKLGFKSVLVVSHVNGWMGYILDANDYDRGGYEATLSFYGRGEGAKVVQAADKALARLMSG